MFRFTKTLAASAALALLATPAMAQDEPEEARTTYQVTMFKFADGADDRWMEIMTNHIFPAQQAAGQTPDVIHWVMTNPDYDIILVSEMEGGMANFDSHASPSRAAFMTALTANVGGEAALESLTTEWNALTKDEVTFYTHTHP